MEKSTCLLLFRFVCSVANQITTVKAVLSGRLMGWHAFDAEGEMLYNVGSKAFGAWFIWSNHNICSETFFSLLFALLLVDELFLFFSCVVVYGGVSGSYWMRYVFFFASPTKDRFFPINAWFLNSFNFFHPLCERVETNRSTQHVVMHCMEASEYQ